MNCDTTDPVDGVDRRSVLAAGAAGLSLSLSGCIDTVRSVVTGDGDDQLSLSIVTVPSDDNREAVGIARHLEENLQEVGIKPNLIVRSQSDFLERVLIDHDFDLYVGLHPADYDPDFLYEALHSTYANESGWQNPFGFASLGFDSLLEEQRRADDRTKAVETMLESLASEKPFEPICRPDEYRVARTDRFDGWDEGHLATRRGYLGLEPATDVERLHALVTDARPSQNVNPLSATVRERGTIIDLLYDSLGTVVAGDDGPEVTPWLAEDWVPADEYDGDVNEMAVGANETNASANETDNIDVGNEGDDEDDDDDAETTFIVTLREGCTFHDGEPVTASDVAFTYRFLTDTALGQATNQSPAPRYRGQVSAVDEIDIIDDRTLEIAFDTGTAVAERALTVPILPQHVWREELKDRISNVDTFSAPQGRWGLVSSNSIPPIGSGPYQFESRSERDHVTFERFDDHFTTRDDVDLLEPLVDEIRFTVDPGSASSIARVASGNADLTSSMLEAYSLGEIPDDPNIERLESPSWTFYHLGFNTRSGPCGNPHFRHAVTQLIDKQWLVDEVFYGHAEPIATPVTDEWVPESLEWDEEDPVAPFVGTEGTVNVEAARASFRAAGLRYNGETLQGRY